MVEPLTTMMSSLPSLSQSIRPIPPLIDSIMYCLSGVETCGTVRPTSLETSLKCGDWAQARENTRTRKRILRITVGNIDYRSLVFKSMQNKRAPHMRRVCIPGTNILLAGCTRNSYSKKDRPDRCDPAYMSRLPKPISWRYRPVQGRFRRLLQRRFPAWSGAGRTGSLQTAFCRGPRCTKPPRL